MNLNPFQGDTLGEILLYGWMPLLLAVIVWLVVAWIVGLFLPTILSWLFASWISLAFIGSMLNSPACDPANRED
ncbi:MAG: hypothetical protein H8E12_06200 [Rhodobacteraceae bacterium]|nr:hypothetical protein [Paracoccaceae bacterium]